MERETGTVKVTAQTGSTDTYTVKAKHSEGLTALAMAAWLLLREKTASIRFLCQSVRILQSLWLLSFPCGTKLTKAVLNSKEVESGKSYDLSTMIDQEKDFVLTDESTGTKLTK